MTVNMCVKFTRGSAVNCKYSASIMPLLCQAALRHKYVLLNILCPGVEYRTTSVMQDIHILNQCTRCQTEWPVNLYTRLSNQQSTHLLQPETSLLRMQWTTAERDQHHLFIKTLHPSINNIYKYNKERLFCSHLPMEKAYTLRSECQFACPMPVNNCEHTNFWLCEYVDIRQLW